MKLGQILLLGLSLAFLIIGVDQTMKLGFSQAYWAFMISLVAFFAFALRKSRTPEPGEKELKRKGKKK